MKKPKNTKNENKMLFEEVKGRKKITIKMIRLCNFMIFFLVFWFD